MKISTKILAAVVAVAGLTAGNAALAVQCAVSPPSGYNYMDATGVSACLASGTGNIGNGSNDPFLQSNPSYTEVSQTGDVNPYSVQYSGGNWSFSPTFWTTYSSGAIGFKFGTGNTPDEWFVYSLTSGVSSGTYQFFGQQAGGLSHITLYSGTTSVPEPATLGLLGAGLVAIGAAARRRRAAAK